LFYFNERAYGSGMRRNRKLYCRRIKQQRFIKLRGGSCRSNGFLPIADKDECEAAATELGLTSREALETGEPNRTEGCYFYHNHQDLTASLWIGTNSANKGIGVQETEDCLRQPVCKLQAVIDHTKSGVHATPAHGKRERVRVALPGSFVSAPGPASSCPTGTEALKQAECREVADLYGGALNDPYVISSAEDPAGCFNWGRLYYFNTHSTGAGREERRIHCRRLDHLSVLEPCEGGGGEQASLPSTTSPATLGAEEAESLFG
jgi:hypothetical protein